MKYLQEHEAFLKEHETMPRKELTALFNAKFKTKVSVTGIKQKCRNIGLVCANNGRFKKGNIPFNKGTKGLSKANRTSFSAGNKPVNIKEIGTVSTRKDKNGHFYKYIKIAEGKWQLFHVYIWEKENGKVPKGYCVIFKDKDTMNTKLDNLMLVSRAELVRLNQKYTHVHADVKETALQVIRISNEIRKKGNIK